jgi:hypothetical protein
VGVWKLRGHDLRRWRQMQENLEAELSVKLEDQIGYDAENAFYSRLEWPLYIRVDNRVKLHIGMRLGDVYLVRVRGRGES